MKNGFFDSVTGNKSSSRLIGFKNKFAYSIIMTIFAP